MRYLQPLWGIECNQRLGLLSAEGKIRPLPLWLDICQNFSNQLTRPEELYLVGSLLDQLQLKIVLWYSPSDPNVYSPTALPNI